MPDRFVTQYLLDLLPLFQGALLQKRLIHPLIRAERTISLQIRLPRDRNREERGENETLRFESYLHIGRRHLSRL